jgi:hypothetical protein
MTRDLLAQILGASEGIQGKASEFSVLETHDAALYLGELGRAMAVSDIARLVLRETYLEVQTRDSGSLYTTYDVVRAVATRKTRDRSATRTGFG